MASIYIRNHDNSNINCKISTTIAINKLEIFIAINKYSNSKMYGKTSKKYKYILLAKASTQ